MAFALKKSSFGNNAYIEKVYIMTNFKEILPQVKVNTSARKKSKASKAQTMPDEIDDIMALCAVKKILEHRLDLATSMIGEYTTQIEELTRERDYYREDVDSARFDGNLMRDMIDQLEQENMKMMKK